jgi:predicted transglutaminase-like protease
MEMVVFFGSLSFDSNKIWLDSSFFRVFGKCIAKAQHVSDKIAFLFDKELGIARIATFLNNNCKDVVNGNIFEWERMKFTVLYGNINN